VRGFFALDWLCFIPFFDFVPLLSSSLFSSLLAFSAALTFPLFPVLWSERTPLRRWSYVPQVPSFHAKRGLSHSFPFVFSLPPVFPRARQRRLTPGFPRGFLQFQPIPGKRICLWLNRVWPPGFSLKSGPWVWFFTRSLLDPVSFLFTKRSGDYREGVFCGPIFPVKHHLRLLVPWLSVLLSSGFLLVH